MNTVIRPSVLKHTYRTLLRLCNRIKTEINGRLFVQEVDGLSVGQFEYLAPNVEFISNEKFVPSSIRPLLDKSSYIDAISLQKSIKSHFRSPSDVSLDQGFEVMRFLGSMINLNERTTETSFNDVSVRVTTWLDKKSKFPFQGQANAHNLENTFKYRIRVTNNSTTKRIQVKSRWWGFRNSVEEYSVPKWSGGLVGQIPTLSPYGHAFEYVSAVNFVNLEDAMMEGGLLVSELTSVKSPDVDTNEGNVNMTVRYFEVPVGPVKLSSK